MTNRFQQRIPNFIEHKPEDRLDITFEDIAEWEATDFYKWHTDNPRFDHFEFVVIKRLIRTGVLFFVLQLAVIIGFQSDNPAFQGDCHR